MSINGNDQNEPVLNSEFNASSLLMSDGASQTSDTKPNRNGGDKRIYFVAALAAVLLLILLIIQFADKEINDCLTWDGVEYCYGDCLDDRNGIEYCPVDGEMPMLVNDMTVNQEAICNDGTRPRILYRDSLPGPNENKWMFRFEGGGTCYDQVSCEERTTDDYLSQFITVSPSSIVFMDPEGGSMNGDPAKNPYFYDYHAVFTHYCSSDGWQGNSDTETYGFIFKGFQNMLGTFEEALLWGLADAEEIIITGYSVGGQGVVGNSEYFHDWLAENAPNAQVTFVSDGGWLMASYPPFGEDWFCNSTTNCPIEDQAALAMTLWEPWLSPTCMAAWPEEDWYKCIYLVYNMEHNPYYDEVYVMENQYDIRQLSVHVQDFDELNITAFQENEFAGSQTEDQAALELYMIGLANAMLNSVKNMSGTYFCSNCWLHDSLNWWTVYAVEIDNTNALRHLQYFMGNRTLGLTTPGLQDVSVYVNFTSNEVHMAVCENPTCPEALDTAPHVD